MNNLPLYIGLGASVIGVIFFLLFMRWVMTLRVVVPTNMVHVVQSRKSSVDYGRGRSAGNSYYNWPSWIPVIGVSVSDFPESIFSVSLKDYPAYDSGRLPFIVNVMAFFRVEDAPTAAQRVSTFSELKQQLENVLQGAVRRVLATNQLESIMQDRSKLGIEFTAEVEKGLSEWGVKSVKTIEFMDIRDTDNSKVIGNIMAKETSRIERESRETVASNRMSAELKEVEAAQSVSIRKQEAEQMIGVRTAEKQREISVAEEQTHQEVLTQQRTTTERNMDVKRVQEVNQAEIARQVAEVKAGQDQRVIFINAEASRDQAIIRADGDLQAAIKNSEATRVQGVAKADAEKAMLLAPVQAQLDLAQGIGSNEKYQEYMLGTRRIEAEEKIGIEAAGALKQAEVKIIANTGGDVQSGVSNVMELFGSKGGTQLGAMLEAIRNTPAGKQVLDHLAGESSADKAARVKK